MAASELDWVPESLYNMAASAVANYYPFFKVAVTGLPDNTLFDVYYKLYNKGKLHELAEEFGQLAMFGKILKVRDKRLLLHHCFQAVMDLSSRTKSVSATLADAYSQHCAVVHTGDAKEKCIQLGLMLGGFLSDAGWYIPANQVYWSCLQLVRLNDVRGKTARMIECGIRLMHVRTQNCDYKSAESMYRTLLEYIQIAEHENVEYNRALFYSEYCSLNFAQSLYDVASEYCCKALGALPHQKVGAHTIVEVFCQSSKVYVIKRDFRRASMLIKYAVQFAKEMFGPKHHKYSDALIDYGSYLLNVDEIHQALKVHQAVLDIRMCVFGGNNLHVAIAHEDLAYCSYVHEYGSGRFRDAKNHAEKSIKIIKSILPADHFLLAAAKRVKALIVEEIAVDHDDRKRQRKLLMEAKSLHMASLKLAQAAFGEENVQVAKHYGNLGRLYQSMKKYEDAEEMHTKAIRIKEKLLGKDDFEVALSVGHLASLYNYDMQKYDEAEQLYLRSIRIGRTLFGDSYSGLEYDYRGLLQLYQKTNQVEKNFEYNRRLAEWNELRHQAQRELKEPFELQESHEIEEILKQFSSSSSSADREMDTSS